ncbi:hypothetical protein F2Q70_00004138 [Brassica cretica]|uniref:Uncharacterized protein n=1 Tax=Brassica cretica TaxID=69181 RepID=A0A3N6QAC9_BRACR|nr:hypothetical protein F2Q70_00004138 [Brassica cretica]KAF3568991.1 hypothetical protein DY000_02016074 [Brassica cretica]
MITTNFVPSIIGRVIRPRNVEQHFAVKAKETSEDIEEEEAPTTPKANRKTKGSSNKKNRETELESPSSTPPAPNKRVYMISWGPKRDAPNSIEGQTEGKVRIDITVAIRSLENLDRDPHP